MAFEIENGVLKKYKAERGETEVVIPDSVTTIGESAFRYRSSLTSVTIPDSVTSIGARAFEKCSSLTSVVIPDSVTSIGDGAFENCSNLSSVVIPDSVTEIWSETFAGCSNLTKIVIPDSVTYIDTNPFNGTKWFEEYPEDFVIVGNGILIKYKGNDENVIIPESVTSIGKDAFEDCSSLTSVVIPDSVTSIGTMAFENCSRLTSIVIPDSVTSIGDGAFENCSNLTSVVIPDSVRRIGKCAFHECENLKNLVIPNSVKEIGKFAFSNTDWFENQEDDDFVIVGDGNLIRINADGDVTIPDTVKIICSGSGWYSEIERIVIPDSVIKIQSLFFCDDCSLHSVTFGNSLKEIASDAFEAYEIEEVYAPDPAVAELVERETGLISSIIERDEQAEQEAEEEVYDFYIENRETWLEEIKNKKSE